MDYDIVENLYRPSAVEPTKYVRNNHIFKGVRVGFEEGVLTIQRIADGQLIQAYAPGEWFKVTLVEDE